MNPQPFETELADIWIRISIHPQIRMRILDHFLLTFQPWRSLYYLSALVLVVSHCELPQLYVCRSHSTGLV